MRVIGGFHRSRKLLPPKDDLTTRPITDRVKQSLFDRLWAMGVFGVDADTDSAPEGGNAGAGGHVLDIFAGTGSLGIEALSRGSGRCVFVEKDRMARVILERNLAELGLTDRSTVICRDALAAAWIGVVAQSCRPVRVIFLDPPYALTNDPPSAARLAELMATLAAAPGLVEPAGILVLRTSAGAVAPVAVAGWEGPVTHPYGSMSLHFYTKA